MRSLCGPTGEAAFKSRVGQQICSCAVVQFNVVDQAFTNSEEEYLKIIIYACCRTQSFTDPDSRFEASPLAFTVFVAIGPIGCLLVITVGIHQSKSASPSIRPTSPTTAGAVADFVLDDVIDIGDEVSQRVGPWVCFRHRQRYSLAAICQCPVVIADSISGVKIIVVRE